MSDVVEEQVAASCTPALVQLSDPLPSSLTHLGLTFTNSLAASATEANATNTTSATASAARPSSSFRVNAIHFDDVAQDAILVCEDSITLFVPLQCDAVQRTSYTAAGEERARSKGTVPATAAPPSASVRPEQQQREQQTATPPSSRVPAVAACLRLGNPHQAWTASHANTATTTAASTATTDSLSSTSALSRRTSVSRIIGERCFPRRLPLAPEELRRSSSVLVAVPVLSLPSSSPSAAAASTSAVRGGGGNDVMEPRTVLSIVIVECAVLPEGVDMIESADIPIARPLRKIVCAPNTLRFREAWYPLHLCCWCSPQEPLKLFSSSSSSNNGGAPSINVRQYSERKEEDSKVVAQSNAYRDYHLLCVSSICVDLLLVRHNTPSHAIRDAHHHNHHHREVGDTRGGYGHPHAPDITTMMNSGHAVRRQPSTAAGAAGAANAVSTATSAPAAETVPEMTVTVLQRYVTHTDWCTYDARSRVLLSFNFTRPAVVKPLAVHYESVRACGTQHANNRGGAERGPAENEVQVSLVKWSELTLPESLCTSLGLYTHDSNTVPSALPHDERLDLLLPCVIGTFTAYGLSFVYHVPTTAHRAPPQLCMNVYLYLPDDAAGGSVESESGDSAPVSPTTTTNATTAATTPSAEAAGAHGGASTGFLKRWAVAASSASASAAPPVVRRGAYILVARLSLLELLSPSSTPATTVDSATSPLRGVAPTSSASSRTAAAAGPHPLSVQVCDGSILLVHHLRTGRSAAFDLAERGAAHFSEGATTRGDEQLTARDFLLWAVASERSRRWARLHRDAPSSGAASAAGATQVTHNRAGSASSSLSNGGGGRRMSAGSEGRTAGGGQGDAAWRRAAGGDWTSMVSAVAGSVLDLSSAVSTITGETSVVGVHLAPMDPLCCCGATMQEEKRGESGEAESAAVEVAYDACVWPRSSRVPLVIHKQDGSLRACRVEYAAVAEWLLLLRASQAAATTPAEQTGEVEREVVTAASLSSFVAFACRHSHPLTEANRDVLEVLSSLATQLVRGEDGDTRSASQASSTHPPASPSLSSYGDVLRRYVLSSPEGDSSAAAVRFSYWTAILEGFTAETEYMDRCAAAERQHVPTPRLAASPTQSSRGLPLQEDIVTAIWAPLWHDLKEKLADNAFGEISGEAAPMSHCHQRRQELLTQQRRRCEELLCGHVRLLHRLAIPVLPALQELLLEVVLQCDLDTGALLLEEERAAASVAATTAGASARVPVAAFMRAVGRAARRVRSLMRGGVVEPSCSTARSLLGWWERYRYQLAVYQQGQVQNCSHAAAASCTDCDEEYPVVHSEDDSAAAEWVFHEAVRLFELHGHLLEVAEALRWRRNFTAAAAVLLRLPRDVLPVEVWEVHGARRSRSSSTSAAAGTGEQSTSSASTVALTNTAPFHVAAPQRTSRLLTWDTLAVAVLDGAWRAVREAEEGCYVLAEKAAAAARSSPRIASPTFPVSAFAATGVSPPAWQLRASERAVQAAHRVYLSVAATLLTTPGIPAAAAATSESTTEFHPTFATGEEAVRGTHTRFNPISSGVSAGYHVHEGRYQQLRQQVEMDWHDMRSGMGS